MCVNITINGPETSKTLNITIKGPEIIKALCRPKLYLRIDHNFCLVHEEVTSIRLYTPFRVTQGCIPSD
jgi:hypothetical protein